MQHYFTFTVSTFSTNSTIKNPLNLTQLQNQDPGSLILKCLEIGDNDEEREKNCLPIYNYIIEIETFLRLLFDMSSSYKNS